MSNPFSDFNALSRVNMLTGIANALFPGGGTVTFTDDLVPAFSRIQLTDDFVTRLTNTRNWWNLDRSEASRRTYIDNFIYYAMALSRSQSLIVTPEESIAPNMARIGSGRIDYLLSAINENTAVPIYNPSVIIEAKAFLGDAPVGENQLLAEMMTLWQITASQQGLAHGILTDGRYWKFYEIAMASGYIFASRIYDSRNDQGLITIMSVLTKFFRLYDSGNSSFT
ncbi:MAG TPA: hypothetical protein VF543_08100 [Pyrinomonadaceae bacterium]|jgi:hypothetical protein